MIISARVFLAGMIDPWAPNEFDCLSWFGV